MLLIHKGLCPFREEPPRKPSAKPRPPTLSLIGPLLVVALVAPEVDEVTDMPEGQVERRLPKLLDELAGVLFVARGGQLIMDGQAHIVSMALWCSAPSARHPQNAPGSHPNPPVDSIRLPGHV